MIVLPNACHPKLPLTLATEPLLSCTSSFLRVLTIMFTASDQIMWECPPMERKWKSNVEIAPKCPRCASSNTKFCYYNNYSLSQPRYFCKGCRRYWTKGGSLRNVPVGGGCRKPRRAKSTRVSHIDRYSKNLTGFDTTRTNDQPIPDGYSANLDATSRPSATNGPDIDLAVVFAKYLNQDSSSFQPQCHGQNLPDESNEFVNLSNSLTPDSLQSDATIEFQKPADLIFQEYSPDLLGGLPQMIVADQELIQSSNSSGVNEIGLQTLLGDEIVQDVLWSDAEPAAPSVSWPLPTVQLQEFDPFPPVEDQPKNAANFLSDNNWGSSFDLSAFEVFSRP